MIVLTKAIFVNESFPEKRQYCRLAPRKDVDPDDVITDQLELLVLYQSQATAAALCCAAGKVALVQEYHGIPKDPEGIIAKACEGNDLISRFKPGCLNMFEHCSMTFDDVLSTMGNMLDKQILRGRGSSTLLAAPLGQAGPGHPKPAFKLKRHTSPYVTDYKRYLQADQVSL